jgi:acetyl esterase/lipase
MATTIKTPDLDEATQIASTTYRGAEYKSDLTAHWTTLYRSRGGKLFLYLHGGGAIGGGFRGYLSRDEAIEWLCSERIAFHEDGLDRAQAQVMVDGC